MKIKQKTTQIHTLQKKVSKITSEVEQNPFTMFEIQKYSDTVGYLISPRLASELFDYLEEMDMLSDRELIRSIKKAKREIERGGGENLDTILEELD